jgi:hypothetical protein
MTLASLLAQLLNGLAGASSLFLVAAGLSLIFGVTRIVNFAHGSFYMLGIYIAWTSVAWFGRGPGFWRCPAGDAGRRRDQGAGREPLLGGSTRLQSCCSSPRPSASFSSSAT